MHVIIRKEGEERKEVTKISAMTRGGLNGFRMKTKKRVARTTKVNCKMKRGME